MNVAGLLERLRECVCVCVCVCVCCSFASDEKSCVDFFFLKKKEERDWKHNTNLGLKSFN